ncbi:hypothetical protein K3495_g7175 [Podosphaera aphanis]|nr:hypothetical protein K3495_g7175 [Podosphaera aphanis]
MVVNTSTVVHSLILDSGPIIKNDPQVSTLLSQAEVLYTIPAVIDEIRDATTRARVKSTLLPFLTLRSPKPASIKFIQSFAQKTGDLEVLSRPDLHLLALAYELECERNHGDWRLRSVPGQKRINGAPPESLKKSTSVPVSHEEVVPAQKGDELVEESDEPSKADDNSSKRGEESSKESDDSSEETDKPAKEDDEEITTVLSTVSIKTIQVALITTDYAMQNVLLRLNLNLFSTSLQRISQLKTWVLRCHGCFSITKDMTKQFCGRCGKPTLLRTACSTDKDGTFRVHLKKNMQWNTRGNVYSIPKPVAGTSNGKLVTGGGKGGWGNSLILAEDQKEYVRAVIGEQRMKKKDLMDDDFLPALLSGERGRAGGKPKVGAGRNVNSKKRR